MDRRERRGVGGAGGVAGGLGGQPLALGGAGLVSQAAGLGLEVLVDPAVGGHAGRGGGVGVGQLGQLGRQGADLVPEGPRCLPPPHSGVHCGGKALEPGSGRVASSAVAAKSAANPA